MEHPKLDVPGPVAESMRSPFNIVVCANRYAQELTKNRFPSFQNLPFIVGERVCVADRRVDAVHAPILQRRAGCAKPATPALGLPNGWPDVRPWQSGCAIISTARSRPRRGRGVRLGSSRPAGCPGFGSILYTPSGIGSGVVARRRHLDNPLGGRWFRAASGSPKSPLLATGDPRKSVK